MIANCGHDERGKYSGGQAGDQTGQEWAVIPWYSRPWNVMLRYPDPAVGKKLADLARAAATNNNIGYDQNQRLTFWNALVRANYDPASISELCEADCSSGTAALIKALGFVLGLEKLQKVSIYAYTGNLRSILKAAGFQELTASKYLTSADYLLPGDVLLLEGHHVAINLDAGKKAAVPEPTHKVVYPYWIHSGNDWYLRIAKGENAHGFYTMNHHRYYFDSKGKMKKDWFEVNGAWYYGQPSGTLEGALYHSVDQNGRQEIMYIE